MLRDRFWAITSCSAEILPEVILMVNVLESSAGHPHAQQFSSSARHSLALDIPDDEDVAASFRRLVADV